MANALLWVQKKDSKNTMIGKGINILIEEVKLYLFFLEQEGITEKTFRKLI
jgi:hypothetical protein